MGKASKAAMGKDEELIYTYVDDLRFINFDVVKKIKAWKQEWVSNTQE